MDRAYILKPCLPVHGMFFLNKYAANTDFPISYTKLSLNAYHDVYLLSIFYKNVHGRRLHWN